MIFNDHFCDGQPDVVNPASEQRVENIGNLVEK